MKIDAQSPEFVAWLRACQLMIDTDMAANFPSLPRKVLRVDDGSKLLRVVFDGGSVYAFVAKVDNETKALGTVRAGDILKPASYAAPAKHARGNILDATQGMGCMTVYGPNYLR
jgi:hypothetical protein